MHTCSVCLGLLCEDEFGYFTICSRCSKDWVDCPCERGRFTLEEMHQEIS